MFVESVEKLKMLRGGKLDEQIDWMIDSFLLQHGVFNDEDRFKYYCIISNIDFGRFGIEEKQHLFDPMMEGVLQTLNEMVQILRKQHRRSKPKVSTSRRLSHSIFLQNSLNPVV